jgi:hypothetical protein
MDWIAKALDLIAPEVVKLKEIPGMEERGNDYASLSLPETQDG